MNRIKQGIMEILGPGSRREEVERGRKERGLLPSQAPHSHCSFSTQPHHGMRGRRLRGRASRFLRA